jgi:hypothetical protein
MIGMLIKLYFLLKNTLAQKLKKTQITLKELVQKPRD